MVYRVAADVVVVVHAAFILFVVGGGFLTLRWPRVAWVHAPAAVYGMLIEFFSWVCILTPLENLLRERGGMEGYETSFTEHYLLPLIYPAALTYRLQIVLGVSVLAVNAVAYTLLIRKYRARKERDVS